jgi:signal transduction histidine kinase/ActR/RegA family two-component response regulator
MLPFYNSPCQAMHALFEQYDWASSPLGPRETWPAALQSAVQLVLDARFPMYIAAGPELLLLYNDAYLECWGDSHPAGFARPLREAWPDAWPQLETSLDTALAGNACRFENQPLTLTVNGVTDCRYFTSSYSPLRDGGRIIGVCCIFTETTSVVLAERRHAFRHELGNALRGLADAVQILEAASRLTGRHLAVGRAGYGEIDAAGVTVSVDRDWTDGSVASLTGESRPLDSFGPAIIEHLRTGSTLCLDDIGADPRSAAYAPGYASIGAHAMVIVPLIEDARLTAIFYLHEPRPRRWTAEEVALAEDVAHQTREALRRARAEETLRDETRMLEALNRSGIALGATLELDTLLQQITDAATGLSGAAYGAFFQKADDANGNPGALALCALSGAAREQFAGLGHPANTAVFRPTLHEQGASVVRSDDITLDPRFGLSATHRGFPEGHLALRSYLAVPVVSRSGQLLGALFFGHPAPGIFTERAERLVAGIAAQAAAAIDNANLYEMAQQSARERDALLQSERAARMEAERLSSMKDEFLAMLAHELRNPLAPISSSASLLSLQFAGEPRVRQASTIIGRQVRHMSRLVDDLLDVSRVTRGLVELRTATVDLRDIVTSALDQTRPLIDERRHAVRLDLPDTPAWVEGDQTRLIQTVANIVNNAAKYTQEGGLIEVSLDTGPRALVLRVRDNGSGMPPELLPSVFELFTQGARTLARSQGGLGLGLALVRKLVELHGGEVHAHSAGVGQGSTFSVILPPADGPAANMPRADMRAQAPPAAGRGLRLMVVDDNVDAADSLASLLRTHGYVTAVEYGGRAALQRAERAPPDAMLIDIGLPDMDGYQLVRHLKNSRHTADMALIAVTGYGQPRDRERALEAGFAHHLVKPLDIAALLKILASLSERERDA